MATEINDLRPTTTIFDGVWRLFTDLRVTLGLLLLGAALLVLLILFPTAIVGVAGPALRIVLALLAFSLALRLAMHIERAARLRSGRYMPPDPALPAETVTLESSLEEVQARAEAALADAYARVIVEENDALIRWWGVHRAFGVIGPILTAAGALVILLGLLVNATWGRVTQDLKLVEGAPAVAAGEGGSAVGLTAGPLLAVERPGRATAYYAASPLRLALVGPYWIYPRAGGSTLQVAATDGAGRAASLVALESEAAAAGGLVLQFRANQTEQTFTSPEQGLAFRVVSYPALPERGIAGPVFLVEAYRQGASKPALSELVEERGDLTVDDTTYSLRRGHYVTADVIYAPGWPLLALGGLASFAGVFVVLLLPAKEAWIDLPHEARGARGAMAIVRTSGGLAPGRAAGALVAALRGESGAGL